MLDPIKHYNDLSPELRKKLQDKVESFGSSVIYLFDIAKDDPHPDNRGKKVFPQMFTLTPKTFTINDPDEKREGKSKGKTIGAIKGLLDKEGNPEGFLSAKVHSFQMGKFPLDLTTREGQDLAMLMELHPKNSNGLFPGKTEPQVFRRIDEIAESKIKVSSRKTRTEALMVVGHMDEGEIREVGANLADVDENGDIMVVRDAVEEFAEKHPEAFVEMMKSGMTSTVALAKKAFDKQVLIYIPLENKVIWNHNQQLVAVLPSREAGSLKTHIELMADWLSGAKEGEKTAKTIKTLVKTAN